MRQLGTVVLIVWGVRIRGFWIKSTSFVSSQTECKKEFWGCERVVVGLVKRVLGSLFCSGWCRPCAKQPEPESQTSKRNQQPELHTCSNHRKARCSVLHWLVFQMTRVNGARACWPMPLWHIPFGHAGRPMPQWHVSLRHAGRPILDWHVSMGHASQWGMLHRWPISPTKVRFRNWPKSVTSNFEQRRKRKKTTTTNIKRSCLPKFSCWWSLLHQRMWRQTEFFSPGFCLGGWHACSALGELEVLWIVQKPPRSVCWSRKIIALDLRALCRKRMKNARICCWSMDRTPLGPCASIKRSLWWPRPTQRSFSSGPGKVLDARKIAFWNGPPPWRKCQGPKFTSKFSSDIRCPLGLKSTFSQATCVCVCVVCVCVCFVCNEVSEVGYSRPFWALRNVQFGSESVWKLPRVRRNTKEDRELKTVVALLVYTDEYWLLICHKIIVATSNLSSGARIFCSLLALMSWALISWPKLCFLVHCTHLCVGTMPQKLDRRAVFVRVRRAGRCEIHSFQQLVFCVSIPRKKKLKKTEAERWHRLADRSTHCSLYFVTKYPCKRKLAARKRHLGFQRCNWGTARNSCVANSMRLRIFRRSVHDILLCVSILKRLVKEKTDCFECSSSTGGRWIPQSWGSSRGWSGSLSLTFSRSEHFWCKVRAMLIFWSQGSGSAGEMCLYWIVVLIRSKHKWPGGSVCLGVEFPKGPAPPHHRRRHLNNRCTTTASESGLLATHACCKVKAIYLNQGLVYIRLLGFR